MELSDTIDRVEELQSMNYEMLDYLRTQLAWLLEYCKKNRIPLPDLEKAKLFFKKSGKILSDERIQPAKNKPSDEEEYRTLKWVLYTCRRIDILKYLANCRSL